MQDTEDLSCECRADGVQRVVAVKALLLEAEHRSHGHGMTFEELRLNGQVNNGVHAQAFKGLASLLVVAEHRLEALSLVATEPPRRVRG